MENMAPFMRNLTEIIKEPGTVAGGGLTLKILPREVNKDECQGGSA